MSKKKIIVTIVCVLLLGAGITYFAVMGSRMRFGSENEMREAMQGQYQGYRKGEAIEHHLFIDGDKFTDMWYLDYEEKPDEYQIEEWDYKNGCIVIGNSKEKLIIKKNGAIKYLDYEFVKTDTLLFPMREKWEQMWRNWEGVEASREKGERVLKVSYAYIEHNSSYTVCIGSIKNEGKKTYKFVQVKGAFEDSSGRVIDTDSTYAVGSEGLIPGESSTFRMSVPANKNIESCTVTVFDYDESP